MAMSASARLTRLNEIEQKFRSLSPYDALGGTWTAGIHLLIQLSAHGPGHSWVQEALNICRETREEANARDTFTPRVLRQAGFDFCEAVELAVAAAAEWATVKRECVMIEKHMEQQAKWIPEECALEEVEVKAEELNEVLPQPMENYGEFSSDVKIEIEVKEEVEEQEETHDKRDNCQIPDNLFTNAVVKEEEDGLEEEEVIEYDEGYYFDEQNHMYSAPSGSHSNHSSDTLDNHDTGELLQNPIRKRRLYETLEEVSSGHDYIGSNSNANHPLEKLRFPVCGRITAQYLRGKSTNPFGIVTNSITHATPVDVTPDSAPRYGTTEFNPSKRDDFAPASAQSRRGPAVWKNGLTTLRQLKTAQRPSTVVKTPKPTADATTRDSSGDDVKLDVKQGGGQQQINLRDFTPSVSRPWKLRTHYRSNVASDRVIATAGTQAYNQLQRVGLGRAPNSTPASAPTNTPSVTQKRKPGRPPKKETGNRLLGRAIAQAGMRRQMPLQRSGLLGPLVAVSKEENDMQ